jgi:hypothetical protein
MNQKTIINMDIKDALPTVPQDLPCEWIHKPPFIIISLHVELVQIQSYVQCNLLIKIILCVKCSQFQCRNSCGEMCKSFTFLRSYKVQRGLCMASSKGRKHEPLKDWFYYYWE